MIKLEEGMVKFEKEVSVCIISSLSFVCLNLNSSVQKKKKIELIKRDFHRKANHSNGTIQKSNKNKNKINQSTYMVSYTYSLI